MAKIVNNLTDLIGENPLAAVEQGNRWTGG